MKKININLKMKIILSFSLILLLLILICLSFINRVNIMNTNTIYISEAMNSIDISRNIQTNLLDTNKQLLLSLDEKNQNQTSKYKEEIERLEKEDNQLMDRYSNIDMYWLDGEEELAEKFTSILNEYRKSRQEAFTLIESKKYKEAHEKMSLNETQWQELNNIQDQIIELNIKWGEDERIENNEGYKESLKLT